MTDPGRGRGKAPGDAALFSSKNLIAVTEAVSDFSFLLTRGYGENSGLAIVGDRYHLTKRQRMMVLRASCSDDARGGRLARSVSLDLVRGRPVFIDGLNILITIEAALSGGVVFKGRDSAVRDIAGVHGTYRKGLRTAEAIDILLAFLGGAEVTEIDVLLDAPVSNSGRIKQMIDDGATRRGLSAAVSLVTNPDRVLASAAGVIVTSDAWILDNVSGWLNVLDILYRRSPPVFDAPLSADFSRV